MLKEENAVSKTSVQLQWLNNCAENAGIFLASFTCRISSFHVSEGRRPSDSVLTVQTKHLSRQVFREQGRPLRETIGDFKIAGCFIVHLKKANRIFSYSRYFIFLMLLQLLHYQFMQFWYYLLQACPILP